MTDTKLTPVGGSAAPKIDELRSGEKEILLTRIAEDICNSLSSLGIIEELKRVRSNAEKDLKKHDSILGVGDPRWGKGPSRNTLVNRLNEAEANLQAAQKKVK